jgi:uncharacterized protein (TIGR02444 family)
MAEAARGSPEEEEFWRFSLAFYARPGVEKALLLLQDERGIDVDLVLYALWLGACGRGRLDRERLEQAEERVSRLREEVVTPLRALRRRLRAGREPDLHSLYEGVKRLELAAEKVEQARLAALSGPAGALGAEEAFADAASGLSFYLGNEEAKGEAARTVLEALRAFLREG